MKAPYVKMIRKDIDNGRDPWISPTMERPSIADVPDGSWNVLQHTVYFPDDQADSSIVSELYLYLWALDVDTIVDLDYFTLELAPPVLFTDTCTDLLRGDLSTGYVWPWNPNGGAVYPLPSTSDVPAEVGSDFMRWELRTSEWQTLEQDLNAGCFVPGAAYQFKSYVKIHSAEPRNLEVTMVTTDSLGGLGYVGIGSCSSSGDWSSCDLSFTSDDRFVEVENVAISFRIPGDVSSVVDLGV